MKLKVLGSAAAEAQPALWCECETCSYARQHGGKDLRRRTCYLIDNDSLVDYGPDIYWQINAFDINLSDIKRLIFTHSHTDHLDPVGLIWRRPGYSVVNKTVKIFGNEAVYTRINDELGGKCAADVFTALQLEMNFLEAGQEVSDNSLSILPIPANHDQRETPFFFVIKRNGRNLLIANDTGFPGEEAWEMIARQPIHAALLDCCGALHPKFKGWRDGHMGADTNVEFREKMLEIGVIDENTPVYANHFSHNGRSLHQELCDYLNPKGLLVAYDGMEIEV